MELHEILSRLIVDTKGSPDSFGVTADSSLMAFLPEIILCATMVLMLLIRIFRLGEVLDRGLSRLFGGGSACLIAFLGVAAALVVAAPWYHLGEALTPDGLAQASSVSRMEIFTGMLVFDTFSVYIRGILLLFVLLFIVLTWLTGIPDRDDGPDIYTLVLGATLGMCLMASANHLLMVFMAIEMASVPSYVLAGLLKGRRRGSEAALKYSIYGAGAAGVLLYGISLISGILNTAHLPTIAASLSQKLGEMPMDDKMIIAVGGLLIMVGLAFKLSAVPFHFWAPDVFEGASAEVGAFLSVASKAAALALLVRVAIGFGALPPTGQEPGARTAALKPSAAVDQVAMFSVASAKDEANPDDEKAASKSKAPTEQAKADAPSAPAETAPVEAAPAEGEPAAAAEASPSDTTVDTESETPKPVSESTIAATDGLGQSRAFIGRLVALFAVITCTFGNLAAYGQTNIKRMLAYSTIAHAGYMMMAIPPMIAMAGVNPAGGEDAVAALAVYIAVYVFMNLTAFAVVAFLRNQMRSEEIADYGGLIRRCPLVVVLFSLTLFSLVGLPPLAGFIGKFAVFASLANGFGETGESYLMMLLVAGGINTAISLFYYLNVVRVMTMTPEPDTRIPFAVPFGQSFFLVLVSLPTLALILNWDWLNTMALAAARHLLT